jgi:hypothetical protein
MNNITFNDVPTVYEHMKGLVALRKDIQGKDKAVKEVEVDTLLGRMFNVVSNFYTNLEKASKDIQTKLPLEEKKPETRGEDLAVAHSDTTNSSVKPAVSTQQPVNVVGDTKEVAKTSAVNADAEKERIAKENGLKALADKQEADRIAKENATKATEEKKSTAPVVDTKVVAPVATSEAKKEDTSTEHCATLADAYEKILPFTLEEKRKNAKIFSDDKFRSTLHQMLIKFCPKDSEHVLNPNTPNISQSNVKKGKEMRSKAINYLENETNTRIKKGTIEAAKNEGGKVINMAAKATPVVEPKIEAPVTTVNVPTPEAKVEPKGELDTKSNQAADAALAELEKAEATEAKEKTIVAPTTLPKSTLHVDIASGTVSDKSNDNTKVADDDLTAEDIKAVEDPNLKAFREHLSKRLVEKGIFEPTKRDAVFNWGVTLLQMRKEEWIKQPHEVEGVMQTKAHNYVLKLITIDLADLRKAS